MAKVYFYATDLNWNTTSNWYSNEAHTVATGVLPGTTDDVILLSPCSNWPTTTVNSLSCKASVGNYVDFYGNGPRMGTVTVTTSAIFRGDTILDGGATISGNVYFFDTSHIGSRGYQDPYGGFLAVGAVNGTAYFYNSAYNGGNITNGYFFNTAYNYAFTPYGNFTYYSPPLTNSIATSGIFYDSSYNGVNCTVPIGIFYGLGSLNNGTVLNFYLPATNSNLLSSLANVTNSLTINNSWVTNQTLTLTSDFVFSPFLPSVDTPIYGKTGILSAFVLKDRSSLGAYFNCISSITFSNSSVNNVFISNTSAQNVIFYDNSITNSNVNYCTVVNNLTAFTKNKIYYKGVTFNFLSSTSITLTGWDYLSFGASDYVKNVYAQTLTSINCKDTSSLQNMNITCPNFACYISNTASALDSSLLLSAYFTDYSFTTGSNIQQGFFSKNSFSTSNVTLGYFYDISQNQGLASNASFFNNSVNTGTVATTAIFNDNTVNRGTVANVIFNDNTFNTSGKTYLNAEFNNINKGVYSTNILDLASTKFRRTLPLTYLNGQAYIKSLKGLIAYYDARLPSTAVDTDNGWWYDQSKLHVDLYRQNYGMYYNAGPPPGLYSYFLDSSVFYANYAGDSSDTAFIRNPVITFSTFIKPTRRFGYSNGPMYIFQIPNDNPYFTYTGDLREDQYSFYYYNNAFYINKSNGYYSNEQLELGGSFLRKIVHVAGVINTTTGTMKLYINGVLANTVTGIHGFNYGIGNYYNVRLALGNNANQTAPFDGYIYNLAFFNNELDASTIQSIFNLNRGDYGI